MTNNVEKWKYNHADQLSVLTEAQLEQEQADLNEAIRLFHAHRVPMTDEMFWLMCALTLEKNRRLNNTVHGNQ